MAKDPAFLFYYQDFYFGTKFMSNEEVGIYIRLLCEQADQGFIPKEHMKNICNGNSTVHNKFDVDKNGNFFNKRLRLEIEKRKNYSKSRSMNRLGKKHMNNISSTYVRHMENENENENIKSLKERIVKENHFDFDAIWEKYPKRVGKKMAYTHFKASVKTQNDFDDLNKALANYLSSKRVLNGFIQNGSTWFNNWRDWINYKEEMCKKCKDKGSFISTTGYTIQCDCPAGKKI